MKHVFLIIALGLAALSLVAWRWRPPQAPDYRLAMIEAVLDAAGAEGQRGLAWSQFQSFMREADANGDGVITLMELAHRPGEPLWRTRLRVAFDRIDANADGGIDAAEQRRLFDSLDATGDGVLTPHDRPAPPTTLLWATDDNPVRREQMDLFNAYHPEYRVVLDPIVGTMEKVIVQCIAGVGPDIFDCYSGAQLAAFVRSGIAYDATEALAARGVDVNEVWPAVHPLILLDDRLYGHPGNTSADAVWYNKRLFDEARMPYPPDDWTWDECIAIAKRLTRRDARGRPVQFGLMTGRFAWRTTFVPQWGGSLYNEEGTRCALDAPEARAGAEFHCDLIYRHGVCPSATEEIAMANQGGWGLGEQNWFATERTAMAVGGRWWLCTLRRPAFKHLRYGVAPLPRGPLRRGVGGGRASLVNRNSPHLEGALAFVAFMHGKEWNQLMNRQADALAPVLKYHYGDYADAFLRDPRHPDEDFNAVWLETLENAIPERPSPFVIGQRVERIILNESDLMAGGLKTGDQAMRDVARDINEAIVEMLRLDPELRARYDALLAQGAAPAWNSEADAP
ncbi:MAG TPA: extracellular solute-binding protein [Candidatus Hydrogenedentes bacterium]|nr:extracellular solute-binding protein [Candidatus Hydrogenedentota bacterium]